MLPAAGEDLGWNQAILHGIDDLEFLVESLRKGTVQPGLIEALGCRQGCLGGFSFRRQGRYAAQSQQFLASLSNWPKGGGLRNSYSETNVSAPGNGQKATVGSGDPAGATGNRKSAPGG